MKYFLKKERKKIEKKIGMLFPNIMNYTIDFLHFPQLCISEQNDKL